MTLIANAKHRSTIARTQRIANYKTLLAALAIRPLEVKEMAELIHVEHTTARKYYLAMLRKGVIQRAGDKSGEQRNTMAYIRAGDDATVESFLAFIAACQTTDNELGRASRTLGNDVGALAKRVVVEVKAEQKGMRRHWLDLALFGDGPAHNLAAFP